MTFDDVVVNVALVGTARGVAVEPAEPGPLADAVASLQSTPPEARLLGTAAILAAYESCGRVPLPGATANPPAAADTKSACSRRAGELLRLVLAMTNTPTKEQLLREWLTLAARAGLRPPHAALPALLEYGAAYRPLRAEIADVLDARARWLIAQNPRWQFTADAREDVAQTWATGSRDQREAALRRLRQTAPTEGRELVRSTWAEDAADERAAFVAALAVSLGDEDEPFLEAALDDKSKQVRAAAVPLLAKLPASRFTLRMIERADGILTLTPGTAGGILKKAKPAKLELALPPKFDPAWARDGLTEKPTGNVGQRQWWARQTLSHVPPAHWSGRWNLTPEQLLEACPNDFGTLLVESWTEATVRQPDPAWAAALFRAAARHERGPLKVELLEGLPEAARLALTGEVLESPTLDVIYASELVVNGRFPFDRRAALAFLAHFDRLAGRPDDYRLPYTAEAFALRVPPEIYDEVVERWSPASWDRHRRGIERALETLGIRRDIAKELTP